MNSPPSIPPNKSSTLLHSKGSDCLFFGPFTHCARPLQSSKHPENGNGYQFNRSHRRKVEKRTPKYEFPFLQPHVESEFNQIRKRLPFGQDEKCTIRVSYWQAMLPSFRAQIFSVVREEFISLIMRCRKSRGCSR
jgi:hypothetical protein